MLEKKPHITAYDGFEPSGRMHIAQARAGLAGGSLLAGRRGCRVTVTAALLRSCPPPPPAALRCCCRCRVLRLPPAGRSTRAGALLLLPRHESGPVLYRVRPAGRAQGPEREQAHQVRRDVQVLVRPAGRLPACPPGCLARGYAGLHGQAGGRRRAGARRSWAGCCDAVCGDVRATGGPRSRAAGRPLPCPARLPAPAGWPTGLRS